MTKKILLYPGYDTFMLITPEQFVELINVEIYKSDGYGEDKKWIKKTGNEMFFQIIDDSFLNIDINNIEIKEILEEILEENNRLTSENEILASKIIELTKQSDSKELTL